MSTADFIDLMPEKKEKFIIWEELYDDYGNVFKDKLGEVIKDRAKTKQNQQKVKSMKKKAKYTK